METVALLALQEHSSLMANPLLLSASFAQLERFLRMVQALVILVHLEQQLQLLDPHQTSAFQSFAGWVSLLMMISALLASLDSSSLMRSRLLLSASLAQWQRFLRMVQALVTFAHLDQQLLAQDLLSAFQ